MTDQLWDRVPVTVRYIVSSAEKRIREGGERPGEATMNTIAALDPDLYAKLLDSGNDFYHADELGLEELWPYLTKYYSDPKAWKEPKS